MFDAVSDCFDSLDDEGRWYINVTCPSCASCPDNKCRFDISNYVELVEDLEYTGEASRDIAAGQSSFFVGRAHTAGTAFVLNVTAPSSSSSSSSSLARVSMRPDRCPSFGLDGKPLADDGQTIYAERPTYVTKDPAQSGAYVDHYVLAYRTPHETDVFVRIDGPSKCDDDDDGKRAERNTIDCKIRYAIDTQETTTFCSKPCKNGGKCVAFDQCGCPEGYSGPTCEQADKKPDNGGKGSKVTPYFIGAAIAVMSLLLVATAVAAFLYYRHKRNESSYRFEVLPQEEEEMM